MCVLWAMTLWVRAHISAFSRPRIDTHTHTHRRAHTHTRMGPTKKRPGPTGANNSGPAGSFVGVVGATEPEGEGGPVAEESWVVGGGEVMDAVVRAWRAKHAESLPFTTRSRSP